MITLTAKDNFNARKHLERTIDYLIPITEYLEVGDGGVSAELLDTFINLGEHVVVSRYKTIDLPTQKDVDDMVEYLTAEGWVK